MNRVQGSIPLKQGSRVEALRQRRAGGSALDATPRGFFPWLNIISVAFGTLAAISSLPFNTGPTGALRTSALMMIACLAVGPVAAGMSNFRNFLRTENVIGLAPIYWVLLDLVTGSYDLVGVPPEPIRKAFIVLGVSMIAFWVGTIGKPWPLPAVLVRTCAVKPTSNWLLAAVLISFFLAMCRFAIPCKFDLFLMFRSAFGARWEAPWGRGQFGGWDAFADHLSYFGYLLPTFVVMIAQRKTWWHPTTLIAMLCSAVFLLFLSQSGSRRIVGVCLGAALMTWLLAQPKVRTWHLVTTGALLACILWVMQMMIVSRDMGLGQMGLSTASDLAVTSMKGREVTVGGPKTIAVDDNFLRLAQTISLVPERFPFVYHKQIIFILVRPIPRVFWEGKPVDAGFALAEYLDSGASLSATILGEFWITMGFPTVILGGWLLGRLARMGSPLFNAPPGTIAPMFYGYITMTLFVGYRSMVEVILFSYALLCWIAISKMIEKFR